ncbi:MAG: type IV pilus biogenesis/stability protein PilW [Gammaproteobacteria bacterium]|nr:type IV pilus biogenesis/stability protein PilW [Gammaproteobacteria bacterium]MCP5407387.1 type IV pilus biogenesis/stability protein PilW [Chromatiaceae bacterium]MCP5443978.1 type IV pilus biogenesis/stability protein PilW [Chromatiaceae bacterium]
MKTATIYSVGLGLMLGFALFLGGCASTGGNRTDMEDSTGALGRSEQPNEGAGDIYVKLAVAYMQNGQMDVALRQAKKALKVEPGSTGAHNAIALIYSRLGENGLAEHHYRTGIEAEPRNPYIHNAYGTFLCQQGRYQEAEQEFVSALKNPLYQTPELAYTNAAVCTALQGSPERSEAYLRKALQTNPGFAPALLQMAKHSVAHGDFQNARLFLQRFAAVTPHNAESLWIAIQTERALGDQDRAASYLLQLKSGFPDSPEAQLARESGVR